MSTRAVGMADEDIYAFSPVPPATAPARRAARRRWPWVLLAALLGLGLLAMAAALGLIELLESAQDGLNVTINGERWDPVFPGPEHAFES